MKLKNGYEYISKNKVHEKRNFSQTYNEPKLIRSKVFSTFFALETSNDNYRAKLAKFRNNLILTNQSKNGFITTLSHDVDPISEKTMKLLGFDPYNIGLTKKNLGKLKIYCGLNSYIVPSVYAYSFFKNGYDSSHVYALNRIKYVLDGMEHISHVLARRFKKNVIFNDKKRAQRYTDMTLEEHVGLLLLPYPNGLSINKNECIICLENDEQKLKTHHIIPSGSFLHMKKDIQIAINSLFDDPMFSKRKIGDFANNTITLCSNCHRSLVSHINKSLIKSRKHPDTGTLWLADLHIILANKIAQYYLLESYDSDLKFFNKVLNCQSDFLDSVANFYTKKVDALVI